MLDRVLPHLGERQRRLVCGALAGALGHGGVTRVAELAGLSIPTVRGTYLSVSGGLRHAT
jgi:hypothetical protein